MTESEQRNAATLFYNKWHGKGDEKNDSQRFWIDFFENVLIEQKSIDKDLNKEYEQSGGWMATPFQQERRYSQFLPVDEAAKWIVACNFKTFEIHDMNKPQDDPTVIALEEVRNKLPLFDFMFKKEVKEISQEMEIFIEVGKIVGLAPPPFGRSLFPYNENLTTFTERPLYFTLMCDILF